MVLKVVRKLTPALFLLSSLAVAKEYPVEKGDTLSQIAQRVYPDKRVYGKNGSLAELLRMNPNIMNPNYVLVGENIRLNTDIEVVNPAVEPIVEKKEETSQQLYDNFILGLGFGPRFYSQGQTGALGKADGQVIFWKNVEFFAGYSRGYFKALIEFASYQMDFDSNGGGKNKQLYRINPKLYYKNFFISTLYEELPLFQYQNGEIKMSREGVFLPGFGYRWVKDLNSHIDTRLEVEGEVNYLVSSKSDKRSVDVSQVSGYGARLEGKLIRRLHTKMPLYYYWSNNLRFRSFDRNISWDSSGKVNSTHFDFNSSVGLSLSF